jgi:hypothetical protein
MTESDVCPITKRNVKNFNKNSDCISYEVVIDEISYPISFCIHCFSRIDFLKYAYLLGALLFNGKLNMPIHYNTDKSYDKEGLNFATFLEEAAYPKTHKEKLNNLFLELFTAKEYDGEAVEMGIGTFNLLWCKYFFKNREEFWFYYEVLLKENYIQQIDKLDYIDHTNPNNKEVDYKTIFKSKVTFDGLSYAIKIQDEGQHSKNCFIAMSFANTTEAKETRKAIKSAIIVTGFTPVIVDEENIDSDQTINDKIIASLKKCKFCIADFTNQSRGVYFEGGFALGQGKKVIYTCEEEDFKKNAHFDIKPLQHIIYKTPQELQQKLIDKIEAWIK